VPVFVSADEPEVVEVPKAPAVPKKAKPEGKKESKARAHWTMREKARVARRAQMIMEADPKASIAHAFIQAQQVLRPTRQRTRGSFHSGNATGMLAQQYKEGLANIWTLGTEEEEAAKDVFMYGPDPDAIPAPTPEAPEVPAEPAADAPKHTAQVFEFNLGDTDTPPPGESALVEASKAFAEVMHIAVGNLMQATMRHTLARMDAKLAEVAANVGAAIAAQIQQGLRQTVMDTMAAELGGPVAAPIAPPVLPVVLPADAVRPPRLKVDVVGLLDSQFAEVKKAFNGSTDLLCVVGDRANSWLPRPGAEVILNTKFIGHNADQRCRSAHVKPIRIQGGPHAVIQAIEELHRAHGIPLH
jgi:hypothetical protein